METDFNLTILQSIKLYKERHRSTSATDKELSALKAELQREKWFVEPVLSSRTVPNDSTTCDLSGTIKDRHSLGQIDFSFSEAQEGFSMDFRHERLSEILLANDHLKEKMYKLKLSNMRLSCKISAQKSLEQRVSDLHLLCSQQETLINDLQGALEKQELRSNQQLREARTKKEELLKNIAEISPSEQMLFTIDQSLTKALEQKNSEVQQIRSAKKRISSAPKILNLGEIAQKLQKEVRGLKQLLTESNHRSLNLQEDSLLLEEEILNLYNEIEEKEHCIENLKNLYEDLKSDNLRQDEIVSELEKETADAALSYRETEEIAEQIRLENNKLFSSQKQASLGIFKGNNVHVHRHEKPEKKSKNKKESSSTIKTKSKPKAHKPSTINQKSK